MTIKRTVLIRRGDILNDPELGISRRMYDQALETGILKPVPIKGFKRLLFRRADVIKVFELEELDERPENV